MVDVARIARSLAGRLALMAGAFALVPVLLYGEFSAAESGKRTVLMARLQVEGQVIARALELGLGRWKQPSVIETRKVLAALDPKGSSLRLLFRPIDETTAFLVAAVPPLPPEAVAAERERLMAAGILRAVPEGCEGGRMLDLRYTAADGSDEVLTALVPFVTKAGCWTVVTSQSTAGLAGTLLDRPYWKSPEVAFAAALYALLAVLVLTVTGGLWLNLRRFGRQARRVAGGIVAAKPFVKVNRIPELDGVAGELDAMVANLRATADAFRFAAEENAHAFKTPIATIAQAVEPLRRTVGGTPAGRSLQVIDAAVERLDALVAASRRLDQVNADLVTPPRDKVDLTRLLAAMLDSYDEAVAERGVIIERRLTSDCVIRGSTELMETVIENVLDNAISFSPAGGRIAVTLARGHGRVVLAIDDHGPGAPAEVLERMFERYVSHRTEGDPSGAAHFGIGLWIVRRNVAAIGGSVEARNRDGGGLRVTVTLPNG
ncbi:MAG: sensor histidine kinase [Magnetospirillum sp.]|nr:sensor histidine kinase [Magnetospirillum sp.]